MFDQIGRDKWNETLKKTKPTLSKVTKDGEHIELAKAGDYVYDLHFREAVKGKRAGLDEAVVFVFRNVGGKYRIVARRLLGRPQPHACPLGQSSEQNKGWPCAG